MSYNGYKQTIVTAFVLVYVKELTTTIRKQRDELAGARLVAEIPLFFSFSGWPGIKREVQET